METPPLPVSEFQVKEACPAADGQQDKPSPDSGCSLGFNSSPSSPVQPGEGEENLGWSDPQPETVTQL